MIPQTGSKVRLVATHGVASPAMRAQIGRTGTVLGARREGATLLVHAGFPTPEGVDDRFWLKQNEFEVVATAQAPAQPAPSRPEPPPAPKEQPMDFAQTLQAQLDRLGAEDDRIAAEMTELATKRGALGRERRALEAARAAYQRVQLAGTESRAPAASREPPAVPFLRDWARAHDGTVVLIEAVEAAVKQGVYGSAQQAHDRLTWALRRHARRVDRGVYRLETEKAS